MGLQEILTQEEIDLIIQALDAQVIWAKGIVRRPVQGFSSGDTLEIKNYWAKKELDTIELISKIMQKPYNLATLQLYNLKTLKNLRKKI